MFINICVKIYNEVNVSTSGTVDWETAYNALVRKAVQKVFSKYQLEDNGGVPDEKPAINLISVPSSVGGAKYVHNILNDILDKGAEDLTNTAIVLPDERLLFPLLNAIPEKIKDINVTMGYPMSYSELWSLMTDIMKMQLHVNRKESSCRFYHKYVWGSGYQ